MGAVNYRDGIAILQLILFPFILASGVWIWQKTGWRAGYRTWRCVVTLSLLRIIGSICTLVAIDHPSQNVYIAAAVCEVIGIAPLLLTYIGMLRQIDTEDQMPARPLNLVTLVTIVALILGIAGVSTADRNTSGFHANSLVKAAMGIFLAIFVLIYLITAWMGMVTPSKSGFQKKFFLAIGLSCPFLLVRLVYSAIGDFGTDSRFAPLQGDPTVYLVMNVLEELAAMAITVAFGVTAMLEKDRISTAATSTRFTLMTEQV